MLAFELVLFSLSFVVEKKKSCNFAPLTNIIACDMSLILGLFIPLLGTMLGAAFVFLMKDQMSARLQKLLLGFASGVMVAASVWSLLIPAMEMEEGGGAWSVDW